MRHRMPPLSKHVGPQTGSFQSTSIYFMLFPFVPM
jgi:hypothetical protein